MVDLEVRIRGHKNRKDPGERIQLAHYLMYRTHNALLNGAAIWLFIIKNCDIAKDKLCF